VTVVLLHDLGDPAGGAEWRAAAPDEWIVPNLPGHGATPATRTGHYDPMSAVAIARWTMGHAANGDAATLVGVRQNAHGALVAAAGRDADRVVVVDGLWGPWRTPPQEVDAFYGMIRAMAADPAATGPAPASGLDPRATHGYGVMVSARFCRQFWGAIEQPILAIETPASTTPRAERAERLSWFGGPTTVVELDAADPATVVAAISAWHPTLT
jgi:hypothetical protein